MIPSDTQNEVLSQSNKGVNLCIKILETPEVGEHGTPYEITIRKGCESMKQILEISIEDHRTPAEKDMVDKVSDILDTNKILEISVKI